MYLYIIIVIIVVIVIITNAFDMPCLCPTDTYGILSLAVSAIISSNQALKKPISWVL